VPVPILSSSLVWALDGGMLGMLSVGIPYILTFYLLLAALEEAAGRPVPVRLSVSTEKKSPEPDAVAPGDAGLERKALEEPTVLEILRIFEGSMLVKVQPSPPAEVPRNGTEADEDTGEPEIPEAAEEAE